MEKRISPWISKKIVEYIGEPEPTLTEFICNKVMYMYMHIKFVTTNIFHVCVVIKVYLCKLYISVWIISCAANNK